MRYVAIGTANEKKNNSDTLWHPIDLAVDNFKLKISTEAARRFAAFVLFSALCKLIFQPGFRDLHQNNYLDKILVRLPQKCGFFFSPLAAVCHSALSHHSP